MNTITEMPLTREELATYVNYYNDIMKTVLEKFAEVTTKQDKEITNLRAELNSSVKTFSDDITSLIKTQTEQQEKLFGNIGDIITIIKESDIKSSYESFISRNSETTNISEHVNKNTGILSSYKSADSISKWIHSAMDQASSLAAIMETTRGAFLNTLYREISEELQRDDIDFNKLAEEYSKTHEKKSKINMIGSSDVLRLMFEKKFNNYYRKYVLNSKIAFSAKSPAEKIQSDPRTIAARKIPAEVQQLLEIITDDGNTVRSVLHKTYNKIRSKYNVDLKDWVNECCAANNLKSCSIAYAISNNEEYMRKFKEVIKEMSREK